MSRDALSRGAAYVFAALAIVGGAFFVASRWAEFVEALSRVSPVYVVFAIFPALFASGLAVLAWRFIWPGLGYTFTYRAASRMFFVSQAGKYIPGSVWPVAAQAAMTSRWRIPPRISIVVGILALAIAIGTGLLVGMLGFLGASAQVRSDYWWIGIIAGTMLILLFPPVLRRLVLIALRLTRRAPIGLSGLGWRRQGLVSLVNVAYWFAIGAHFWLILVGLGADPVNTFLPAVAGFAVSFCLGVLFVPAPAGIGVREAALVVTLGASVGPTDALTAALISRVMLALIDFMLAGTSYAFRTPESAVRKVPVVPSS